MVAQHDSSAYFDSNMTDITTGGKGPHVDRVPLESISKLAPFSALILSIIFVFYFVVRHYIFEGFLLRKVYGKTYTSMDENTRRGFVNHHIAGSTKILILIFAIYPFIDVAFGTSTLHSSFAGSPIVTQGDVLLVVAQMLVAMYVFELFYRPKISPVSVGHHIGTIMIAESAIAISLNLDRERDATIEFILCLVWGAFDIVAEFFPHICIILYRVYPTSHDFLRRLFRIAAFSTFTGTMLETVVTMWLFGTLWDKWTLDFKVATPLLHVVFMACQMWGTYNFYKLYQKQCRYLAMERKEVNDPETGSEGDRSSQKKGATAEVTSITTPEIEDDSTSEHHSIPKTTSIA